MNNIKVAETIRLACLEAALEAYENAGISGLCAEGRWEYAIQAIQDLNLESILSPPNSVHKDKSGISK